MSNGNRSEPAARQQPEVRKQKAATRRRRRERERARRPEGSAETVPTAPDPSKLGTGAPRERLGLVVSDKADKTITVRIDSARRHRQYKKIIRRSMTLHAHDERNQAGVGDTVRVVESRPLSATKRWRLVEVTERAR
ncbi:MAG: 30S ribosomal protein S17 [Thermoleophilaceae bacterium]|jgi:small subunit ribosomal protein S17